MKWQVGKGGRGKEGGVVMRWQGGKGARVVRWERWENGEVARWEVPGFIQEWGTQSES